MIDIPRPAVSLSVPPGRVVVGAYLRGLRESRGLDLKDVAHRLDYAVSSLGRMERGGVPLRPMVVTRLLQEYAVVEPQEIRAVTALLDPDRQHLDPHSARARDRLASCWRVASAVRVYAGHWLPPAVHTLAYARAYTNAHRVDLRGPSGGVAFPEPGAGSRLTLLVDEDVLGRPVGGRDVMEAQLAHLQRLVETGNLVVRILPLNRRGPFIRTPVIELDPYGYPLFVEISEAGMRYSPGGEFGAAVDRAEESAVPLDVGYDRLEAARSAFEGGRS